MSQDILVKVGADISQFSRAMSDSTKSLKDFGRANAETFGAFKKAGDRLTKGITIPAAAAASALTGITLVKGFQRLTGIDTAQAKLRGLGHDAKSVELIMESALDSVRGTSYGMDEAATTAASAVAAGIKPGKELTRYLSLTGDAAAIAGESMANMGSIINKVQTANRAYTGDLNMLSDRGIPIYQWLAKEAGTSAEAVREMASSGEISSEMFLKSIEDNIGGAAKTMGEESFTAGIANIGAAISRLGANFLDAGGEAGGFFSTLKPLIPEAIAFIDSLADKSAELGERFGNAVVNMLDKLKQVKAWFDDLSPSLQDIIKKGALFGSIFAVSIGPILKIVGLIPAIISGITTLGTILATLLSPAMLVVAGIAAIGAALVLAYNKVEWFRDLVDEAWAWIVDIFSDALEFIKEIATNIFGAVTEFFGEQLAKITEFWDEYGAEIMDLVIFYFEAVWEYIKLVINLIKGIFETIWPIISNVVRVAWNYIKMYVQSGIDLVLGIIKTVLKILKGDWSGAWNSIKDTAKNIMNNIVNFFKSINLLQIGKDVINGFVNGIKSMAGAVKDAVLNIVDKLPGWVKKPLGIKSPSRLFMSFGDAIGEGLAIGIDNASELVGKAADNLVNIAKPEVSEIDLSYATPDEVSSSLYKSINGTIDVNGRESGIISELQRLRAEVREQRQMIIELDGREVGRAVEPEVSEIQARKTNMRRKFM